MELTQEELSELVEVARRALREALLGEPFLYTPSSPKLEEKAGAFVTLEKGGQLRGCIGYIEPIKPLWVAVRENAVNAALNDPRFPPVQPEELEELDIEVSVLTPPEPFPYTSPEELLKVLERERPGVILSYGGRRAVFLPQVWEEIPDPVEFLDHLSLKAGLSPMLWREGKANVELFRVVAHKEPFRK